MVNVHELKILAGEKFKVIRLSLFVGVSAFALAVLTLISRQYIHLSLVLVLAAITGLMVANYLLVSEMIIKNKTQQQHEDHISECGDIAGCFDYLEIAELLNVKNILRKPFTVKELTVYVAAAVPEPS